MSAKPLRPRARKAILTLHVSASVALIGVTGSVLILFAAVAVALAVFKPGRRLRGLTVTDEFRREARS
jgi:hypothetical protein